MADIHPDQKCSDLLNDARVFESAAIDGAHSQNFARQGANLASRLFAVGANDDVAIYRSVMLQNFRRRIVKCGNDSDTFRRKFRCLLRGRALPDTQNASGPSADTHRQWHGRIHENLTGP